MCCTGERVVPASWPRPILDFDVKTGRGEDTVNYFFQLGAVDVVQLVRGDDLDIGHQECQIERRAGDTRLHLCVGDANLVNEVAVLGDERDVRRAAQHIDSAAGLVAVGGRIGDRTERARQRVSCEREVRRSSFTSPVRSDGRRVASSGASGGRWRASAEPDAQRRRATATVAAVVGSAKRRRPVRPFSRRVSMEAGKGRQARSKDGGVSQAPLRR